MKFVGQCFQNIKHDRDRQTDSRDRTHYQPHSRVLIKCSIMTAAFMKQRENVIGCILIRHQSALSLQHCSCTCGWG